jgi:hypothetical protein
MRNVVVIALAQLSTPSRALLRVVNLSTRVERSLLSPTSFWQKLGCGVEPAVTPTTASPHAKRLSSSHDDEILSQYNRRNVVDIGNTDVSWKVSRNVPTRKTVPQAKKKHWCESNRGTLQWLVWGLNCVVAHYNCSHSTSTTSSCPRGALSILSLFAALPAQHAGKTLGIWEMLSNGFTQMPPWCVHFSDVHVYGGDGGLIDPLENTAALTGCIVGLGKRPPGSSVGVEDCIGVGMIRALNTRSQMLYIIAPLSPSQLEKVDCLLVRDVQMNPPLNFKSTVAGGLVSSSPYVCSNGLATEGTGARAIRSRNNILRKQ